MYARCQFQSDHIIFNKKKQMQAILHDYKQEKIIPVQDIKSLSVYFDETICVELKNGETYACDTITFK